MTKGTGKEGERNGEMTRNLMPHTQGEISSSTPPPAEPSLETPATTLPPPIQKQGEIAPSMQAGKTELKSEKPQATKGVNGSWAEETEGEIEEYCISDVDILTEFCLKFGELLISETNVCPFMEATTITSACNKEPRRNFLNPNTIGIIPKRGYKLLSNGWFGKNTEGVLIFSMLQKIRRFELLELKWMDIARTLVFEFEGGYYHGCPNCFKYQRDAPLNEEPSETLDLRYEATIAKKIDSNDIKELQKYVENHPLVLQTPLIPRDAFYGGRTGSNFEYYKAQNDEKIKYVDVCSLYPWFYKYGKCPVGHPLVYIGSACPTLNSVSGLIKCKVLPPRELFHPVLSQRMNNKIMFVLCRECRQNLSSDYCSHSVGERSIIGVEEVLKAIEKGYKVLEKYEIWAYDTVQFGKDAGLFTAMMNKFIKIKQESSVWPSNCQTQTGKIGILTDSWNGKISHWNFLRPFNPGLRSLAKLILNFFWGKFRQRVNQPKTSIVNQSSAFFSMMSIYVNTVPPVNEDTLIVNWEYREEASDSLDTLNVVIAAFVTAQARLKLYSYLEQLEERILYNDTDSVIYVSKPGEFDIPAGEIVGDMTDELEEKGLDSYITEFVSGGPKNYSYTLWSTKDQEHKTVCEVTGISLNYSASQLINFDVIKDMVLTPCNPIYIVNKQIRRTQKQEVVTLECHKKHELRNYVNAAILREKKAHVEFALRQNNSKITWNRLRTLKIVGQKNSYEIPPELKNSQDINSHFISIPSIDKTEAQSRLLDKYAVTFELSSTTEYEVAECLYSIKSEASGCDNISRKNS
ncbi:hypothetical protein JTB14_025715 [Gonioctena quinquepunctata]|nr:hypothetical protein JTB14_025715 [Gonioctena quinquepunctata]